MSDAKFDDKILAEIFEGKQITFLPAPWCPNWTDKEKT